MAAAHRLLGVEGLQSMDSALRSCISNARSLCSRSRSLSHSTRPMPSSEVDATELPARCESSMARCLKGTMCIARAQRCPSIASCDVRPCFKTAPMPSVTCQALMNTCYFPATSSGIRGVPAPSGSLPWSSPCTHERRQDIDSTNFG